MRRFALFCCAALLGGCTGQEQSPAMDTTATSPAAASPAGAATADSAPDATTDSASIRLLAVLAGRWNMRAIPTTGDSTLVRYVLAATSSRSGWTVTFPDREPIPVRVIALAGDSLVTEMGPYSSALRKDVMVTTRTVSRLRNDSLVGTFMAGYSTTGPDSLLRGRIEGTRAP
jgi:hypothetical protein